MSNAPLPEKSRIDPKPKGVVWSVAHGRTLQLGDNGRIMGIVNVTPDSFSDGGVLQTTEAAVAAARRMKEEGASIIDIGGESTRPGAAPIDAPTEQSRVLPVIEALASQSDVLISVDTYRSSTAEMAVERGAHIVNDVWGLQRDAAIADVAARTGAGLCIMHTGRERATDPDPIVDQRAFFDRSLEIASHAGVERERIVLDPGFGFAKETDENFVLMAEFETLADFGYPLLVGTSRKRFLGAVTGREARDRDIATAATSALLRISGAALFRVHDVASTRDALAVADAMLRARSRRKMAA